MDPVAIEPMHSSSIEGLRSTGLTLTEPLAMYEDLKDLGPKWKTIIVSDKMADPNGLGTWYDFLTGKFEVTLG
jgi:hypothetical protein